MNRVRRNQTERERERLDDVIILLPEQAEEARKLLEDIRFNVEQILDEEQYAFDRMPENLQGSQRGFTSEECIDALCEAEETLEEVLELLGSEGWTEEEAEELIDDISDSLQDVVFS